MDMVTITPDVTAVVWDLDGTLLSSFSILENLVKEISAELGIATPTRQSLLDNFHGTLHDTFENVFKGQLSPKGINAFEQLFLDKQHSHYDNLEGHLLPDAIDLSTRLAESGVTQILVTNRNHKQHGKASARSIVEYTLLKDHIEHVICGDDSEFRKPDPRVIEDLLNSLGVTTNEVLVIGDQYVDAQFALNLGCNGIIVSRDGADFAHEKLSDTNWQQHITIVESLSDVLTN